LGCGDKTGEDVRRAPLPWLAVIAAPLIYGLVVVAANGTPHFPTRHDCIHPATRDGSIDAVFMRFTTITAAQSLQRRVEHAGFQNVQVEGDGCGLFKVVLHGIPTLAVARDFVQEAEGAAFHPTLEQTPR
jgi:hypothetical protein